MLLLCNNDRNDGPDFADVSAIETLKRVSVYLFSKFKQIKNTNTVNVFLFFTRKVSLSINCTLSVFF